MKISELIEALQEAKDSYGDINVTITIDNFAEPFEENDIISTETDEKSITLYNF